MKYLIIFILPLIMLANICSAQGSYVKAGYSAKEKAAVVKWFAEKNFFEEGVIIYRKDNSDNNWVKLTDKPLKKASKLSEGDKESDSTASIYNYIIYNKPEGKDEYENWEFTLITYSLLDNNFAKYATLGYVDDKIDANKSYSYKVTYLRSGSEVELGVSNETGANYLEGNKVSGTLTAVQNKNSVRLNWTPEPEKFIAYNIYREGSSGKVKVNDEAIFSLSFSSGSKTLNPGYLFADSSLTPDTYNYTYAGLDAFGNESQPSAAVSITVLNSSLPPKPIGLHSDGNNKLTVFWRVQTTENLKGFNILRTDDVKNEFAKINSSLISPADTSYVDNTAEPDKRYFYSIASVSMTGFENYGGPMAASFSDYSKPVPPANVRAESDSNTVKLSWDVSVSTNVIGYKIFRTVKGQKNDVLLLTPLPVKENNYTDTLLKSASNDFEYSIVAVNQVYINSDYIKTGVVKLKDSKAPTVPVIKSVSLENNSALVEWIPVHESDLAGYKVYRSEDSISGFAEISVQPLGKDAKSFSDGSLVNGKTYYYKVASQDASGNISAQSDLAEFTMLIEDTKIPEIKINALFNKEKNAVDINWNAVELLSSPLQGYIVMRRAGDEEYSFASSDILKVTSFSDDTIESPAKYFYSIKIFLENGDVITSPEQLIELN